MIISLSNARYLVTSQPLCFAGVRVMVSAAIRTGIKHGLGRGIGLWKEMKIKKNTGIKWHKTWVGMRKWVRVLESVEYDFLCVHKASSR